MRSNSSQISISTATVKTLGEVGREFGFEKIVSFNLAKTTIIT